VVKFDNFIGFRNLKGNYDGLCLGLLRMFWCLEGKNVWKRFLCYFVMNLSRKNKK
jgi:hypothetical protein